VIRTERHGDVTRFEMSSRRSRLLGFSVSAYLLRDVLVDTGFPGVGDEFERLLSGGRVAGVVLTHWHEDHAGNAEAVARRGIPMAVHGEAIARLRAPRPIRLYRRFTWGSPAPLTSPIVDFDPGPLALIHAPGHSADHQAVWDAATGTLIAGDLFLGIKVRIAHEDEQPRALAASLRRVMALEPARLFDAHRGLVPNATQALGAKLAWLEETIGQVESLARAGTPAREIERRVLGGRGGSDYLSGGEYSRASLVHAILAEGAVNR
jgi:glyoxylase-like metal-dependent hydrolase (beta-lactamase superfamily II)